MKRIWKNFKAISFPIKRKLTTLIYKSVNLLTKKLILGEEMTFIVLRFNIKSRFKFKNIWLIWFRSKRLFKLIRIRKRRRFRKRLLEEMKRMKKQKEKKIIRVKEIWCLRFSIRLRLLGRGILDSLRGRLLESLR